MKTSSHMANMAALSRLSRRQASWRSDRPATGLAEATSRAAAAELMAESAKSQLDAAERELGKLKAQFAKLAKRATPAGQVEPLEARVAALDAGIVGCSGERIAADGHVRRVVRRIVFLRQRVGAMP